MIALKKNQCAFSKEEEQWKVDCSKLKGKKKESKPEVNVAQVKSSHVDGLDSDSSVILLAITTPTVCYSDVTKCILDTGATYHVCLKRDWSLALRS